ncbi:MAG: hypothetical protein U0414_09435 [Polyangiaceae bacterium]
MVLTPARPLVHYALVEATGVDVDVRINGCPLDRVESTGRVESAIPVSDLLVPGPNAIEVERVRGAGHATVRLGSCRYGDVPDAGADASWTVVRLRALPADASRVDGAATLHDVPSWPWLTAGRIDPESPSTRADVMAFLRGVERTLAKNDHASLLGLLRQRLEERGVAFGQGREAAVRAFTALTADADFRRFDPLGEQDLELTSCFGGRALWVRRRGAAHLYAEPSGDWEFALCVARVDGALRVVRS